MKMLASCRQYGWAVLAALVVGVGCGGVDEVLPEGALGEGDVVGEVESELSAGDLAFTEFVDPQGIGNKGQNETRVVFATAAAYRSYFGHNAPSVVKWNQGEGVIFYSAGTKSTGGYSARVLRIRTSASRKTLHTTTQLVSPGPGCFVTQAFTKPYVLVKFKRPSQTRFAVWTKNDTVERCNEPVDPCAATLCLVGTRCVAQEVQCIAPPCDKIAVCVPDEVANPCMTVRCTAGTHCEVVQVQCVTTPCNPVAQCVPNAPTRFCGGIAGIACPGAGNCVDDPNDSCQPGQGADCGGMCSCDTVGSCPAGSKWDSSPDVCGCKPVTPPTQCGGNTCAAGTVCCNASCGICTPPGMSCIQIAC